jgi:hypothetical protein
MMDNVRTALFLFQEGKVQAMIALCEYGVLDFIQLRPLMKEALGFKPEEIDYWLDYYRIEG